MNIEIEQLKIGFLGFGKMGQAIAGGILKTYPGALLYFYDKENVNPALALHTAPDQSQETKDNISGSDLNKEKKQIFITKSSSISDLENICDVILLCVKPSDMNDAVLKLTGKKLYISIAAGLSIAQIQSYSNSMQHAKIARVMPNVAALVKEAVNGIYCDDTNLKDLTNTIFSCTGPCFFFSSEDKLHAVTALSGSGPAFVFSFIQSLAEGGVLCGIPYDSALEMAVQTVIGAAILIKETKLHPDTLRNQVTSAGGTTIAGLLSLEKSGTHGHVMEAVKEAYLRSKELAGS